jgi:Ca2+-binding RTX toxin-like protein
MESTTDLNNSPEIAELYALQYAAFQAAGGGTLAHYLDYGLSGKFGSWGTLDYLGQDDEVGATTYKHDFLEDYNEVTSRWWQEDRDPGAFLQGVTEVGTAADDILAGTVGKDILLGGDGNDTLIAGPGDDHLFGGAGTNIIDAGDGDDLIVIASAADTVDGGAGTDTIRLSS